MRRPPRLIIFDLDGTLIDSLASVAGAMNRVLARRGLATFPTQRYLGWIGWGTRHLVVSALNAASGEQPQGIVEECLADMQREYAARPTEGTTIYAGIPELLAYLNRIGIVKALLTNKPHVMTELVVERLFGSNSFACVQGAVDHLPLKPDPAGLLEILRQLGLSAAESICIGDSDVDVELAAAAGTSFIGAGWGFQGRRRLLDSGARIVYDSAQQVIEHLEYKD